MENGKKTRLNVLSITSTGDFFLRKGNEGFSGALARQVDYSGFLDHYVILSRSRDPNRSEVVMPGNRLKLIPVFGKRNGFSYLFRLYALSRELIGRERINCLVCDSPYWTAIVGVLLKRKWNVPLIVHHMADMMDNPQYLKERWINRMKNFLAKKLFRFFDLMRLSTESEYLRLTALGYDGKKLHVAPFYIDFKDFSETPAEPGLRARILGDQFQRIVLFVGRIARQKDLKTLIRSIPRVLDDVPGALFLLVGSGPETKRIRKLIHFLRLDDHVRLMGGVPYSEVKRYYPISDIFCITSLYEGTCMVLEEAAAARLPVVATDFAGANDLIRNGENGFIVRVGDAAAVAERVAWLLQHESERIRMGEANHRMVEENFSRAAALKKCEEMFRRVTPVPGSAS